MTNDAADDGPIIHQWRRFWVPRTGTVNLGDGGFLVDPESPWFGDRQLVTLPSLEAYRALALLGEPGIGKSVTLREETERLAAAAPVGTKISIRADLRSYSSETLLYQRVFESAEVVAWKNGSAHLVLHLDSLDEALLRIESIASLLADTLPLLPTDRLSVRFACRTAVWPSNVLEPVLRRIWGKDAVGVFELAPLRRKDVVAAAQDRQIDADAFVKELNAANAVPFAIKPLTLNMVMSLFQQHGRLPHSVGELYEAGCLSLCEEQNPSRRDAGRLGRLTAPQRLRLAGRLAAVTMLANKFAIWTGPTTNGLPTEDVPLGDLAVGREEGNFQPFDVSDANIRETLDTGLFSSRGPSRIGWAHLSYAEFLAARYVIDSGTSPENILKIVKHPSGGLVPQLAVVTAWIASMNKAVRDKLIASEPLTLLSGDLGNWKSEDLARLTASLLDAFENRNESDFVFGIAHSYAKLKHADLAPQLRPYIVDKAKKVISRRAALTISETCGLSELQPELLQVALDESDDPGLRARAVSALGKCGDSTIPAVMLPLARGAAGPDPRDDIKGHALEFLWPEHLSANDLFSIIQRPSEGYLGSYAMFLTHTLPETLKPADLAVALPWATALLGSMEPSGDYHRKSLADSIFILGWKHYEIPALSDLFIDHVMARLRQHGDLFKGTSYSEHQSFLKEMKADLARRRGLLTRVAQRPLHGLEAFDLRRVGLLEQADFEWLVSISPGGANTQSGCDEQSLCALIECAYNFENPSHFDLLFDAAERWPLLHHKYSSLLDGIQIGSPEAERARRYQEQINHYNSLKPPPLDPPAAERVAVALKRFEEGDADGWWRLNCELTLDQSSQHYGHDWDYDIVAMPGWADASDETKRRILDAAERSLAIVEPRTREWIGIGPAFRSDLAAYRALILLKRERPDAYANLVDEIWRKWAPVAAAAPRETGSATPSINDEISGVAATKAPLEFASALGALLRGERSAAKKAVEQGGKPQPITFFGLRYAESVMDNAHVQSTILGELTEAQNSPGQYGELLDPLLKQGVEDAFANAISAVNDLRPDRRLFAMEAAASLAARDARRAWPEIWARMSGDDQFGIDLILRISHLHEGASFYASLTEDQVGDLIVWFERAFPRAEDPAEPAGHAHFVGPRESAAHERDRVLGYLINAGTPQSVAVLRRIVGLFPNIDWLPYRLMEAEKNMRLKTWEPLSTKDVLKTTASKVGHLVQLPEDLLELLANALRKYEHELHGEQSPIRSLWDRQAGGNTLRPVEEDAISDHVRLFLKRELVDSGIVLNREVELKRAPGAPIGTRTDIKVDALRRSPDGAAYDSITAVIETKGCWNAELFTAIKSQLYDRYLVPLGAPVGVYLVAWFDKPKWDDNDGRKSRSPDRPLLDVQADLNAQSSGLPGCMVQAMVLDFHAP